MDYKPPVLKYRRIVSGYGLYIKKVGCAHYVSVTRASDHKYVAKFDAPYSGKIRDLYRVFEEFGSRRVTCPEMDEDFTPEAIVDVKEWKNLLKKNLHGSYELFST